MPVQLHTVPRTDRILPTAQNARDGIDALAAVYDLVCASTPDGLHLLKPDHLAPLLRMALDQIEAGLDHVVEYALGAS